PNSAEADFIIFKKEVKRLKTQDLSLQLQISKNELNELVDSAKGKIGEDLQDYLDIFLEAQVENDSNNFVVKQIERAKNKLDKKLSEQELQALLTKQKEVDELEKQLEYLQVPEQKYKTQIEVWTKK